MGVAEADKSKPADKSKTRYRTPIRRWSVNDRPREKLLRQGPAHLATAELLGILFVSGVATSNGSVSAVEVGRTIISQFGDLQKVSRASVPELQRIPGVGPAKIAKLKAVFEIARRLESTSPEAPVRISSPSDVYKAYGPVLRDLPREVFRVVFLNTANFVLADRTISEGGLAASIVEPRAVFQAALEENAASIICLHNHPSGNPEPSREDIRVTKQLQKAGEIMGIALHDHIIIAGRSFTSLAEYGVV